MGDDTSVSLALQNALADVDAIDAKLDQFERTRDKKTFQEVTTSMKQITQQLRELGGNPKCRTKENAPLLSQLSNKMKDLVKRTKTLASVNTPLSTSPTVSTAPSTSLRTESSIAPSTMNNNATRRTNSIERTIQPLKGWLKKQGEDVFKGWKKRYFQQKDNKLCYYATDSDDNQLGFIDLMQVNVAVIINKEQFDLQTANRVYHLQVVTREEDLKYWVDGLNTWIQHYQKNSQMSNKTDNSDNKAHAEENVNQATTIRRETKEEAMMREERQKKELERLEIERQEKVMAEMNRREMEKQQILQREKREKELEEQKKKAEEDQEKERAEKEKQEEERLLKERIERERIEKEKVEEEKREKERLEKEVQDRLVRERAERERVEQERIAKEKEDKERQEQEERDRQEAAENALKELHFKQRLAEAKAKRKEEEKLDTENRETIKTDEHKEVKTEAAVVTEHPEVDKDKRKSVQNIPAIDVSNVVETKVESDDNGSSDEKSPRASFILSAPASPISLDHAQSKDEIIAILLEKVKKLEQSKTNQDNNQQVFKKLEEELRQKEKQYEFLRGKHKLDLEAKKIAEERLELMRVKLKEIDEENKGKDSHIRQLQKKLKQARKDWISKDLDATGIPAEMATSPTSSSSSMRSYSSLKSPQKTWEMNPEIDLKNREIQQLKEAIWAHQNQNAMVSTEFDRFQKESASNLKVKDEVIKRLEKELSFTKETYQSIREKYLSQQIGLLDPEDKSLLSQLQKLKKSYFFSVALNCKLSSWNECNLNVGTLYEKALSENVEWEDWPEWISAQLSEYQKEHE